MDSLPESKNRELGWGFFVSVCLVLFTVSLMASLGILMMERKCSIQISFLKCVLISEKQSAKCIVGLSLKLWFFLC